MTRSVLWVPKLSNAASRPFNSGYSPVHLRASELPDWASRPVCFTADGRCRQATANVCRRPEQTVNLSPTRASETAARRAALLARLSSHSHQRRQLRTPLGSRKREISPSEQHSLRFDATAPLPNCLLCPRLPHHAHPVSGSSVMLRRITTFVRTTADCLHPAQHRHRQCDPLHYA